MKTSETIKEIIPALIAAQAEFKPAIKNADNPFHRSKYVPLDEVIAATEEALRTHGLTVVQGGLPLVTRLFHTSGEWIETVLDLPMVKQDPQSAGSATTYARRYSLMALLGIAPVDDDGQEAMPAPTTEINGETMVKGANGWERPQEVKNQIEAMIATLRGLRAQANLSNKEAELLTGCKWTTSLPVTKLNSLIDQMTDFIERKEANQLTDDEIKLIKGEAA